ncbi:MAG: RluA family pseudouridine synthase, partial [Deltaproteobacteria bacterium]|nr:RluA family pseudouridine synthase [Deltaproteobacteria bacterium]
YLTKPGDVIGSDIPPREPLACKPEPIPLSIIYEDSDVIVLDKPADLVVHPGAGHKNGTLVNALLFHCPDLEGVGNPVRPGIVHRLDKDTSGCMVVAKNHMAHESLSRQFKLREIGKVYLALVYGKLKSSTGVINLPIGRHPKDRTKMSTRSHRARSSETRWKVKEEVVGLTLLEIELKTGRTHQVRVHCAAMGHPVVGDVRYGRKRAWQRILSRETLTALSQARRQLLHAWRLTFSHPQAGTLMSFESPLPEDMVTLLDALRHLAYESPSG